MHFPDKNLGLCGRPDPSPDKTGQSRTQTPRLYKTLTTDLLTIEYLPISWPSRILQCKSTNMSLRHNFGTHHTPTRCEALVSAVATGLSLYAWTCSRSYSRWPQTCIGLDGAFPDLGDSYISSNCSVSCVQDKVKDCDLRMTRTTFSIWYSCNRRFRIIQELALRAKKSKLRSFF